MGERDHMLANGKGAERIPSRFCTVITEPNIKLSAVSTEPTLHPLSLSLSAPQVLSLKNKHYKINK